MVIPGRWSSSWRPRSAAVFYSPGNGWPFPEPGRPCPGRCSSDAGPGDAASRHAGRPLWAEVSAAGVVGSALVRCPRCSGVEDRVMDSRTAEEGAAIRRRRECLACGLRFTTYERLEEVPFVVIKRSGHREPFERAKVVAGLKAAGKNRPLSLPLLEQIAAEVEETLAPRGLRSHQPAGGPGRVGRIAGPRPRRLSPLCQRVQGLYGRRGLPARGGPADQGHDA